MISDIWDADTRGKAMATFTLAPLAGPTLGPIVSGFMNVAGVSWRWIFWVQAIFAGSCLVAIIFIIPETYAYAPLFMMLCAFLMDTELSRFRPVLLVKRAQRKRKETGDDRYWAPLERKKMTLSERLKQVVAKPFIVLFTEPMLMAMTLYMGVRLPPTCKQNFTHALTQFIYGIVYLLFEAFPIVFTEGHHFNSGISGLMYIPYCCGGVSAVLIYLTYFNPHYTAAIKRYAPHPVPPEVRMEVCVWAAPIFGLAFFWFGWTSYPSVSFWAPMMAGYPMGLSTIFIFLGIFNYTIDAYLAVAASALSAITVVRSLFGAAFPLFATQMFEALNPRWASTLLGCIALLMMPIPIVLRRYGHVIRARSKYAPSHAMPPKVVQPVEDEEKDYAGAKAV